MAPVAGLFPKILVMDTPVGPEALIDDFFPEILVSPALQPARATTTIVDGQLPISTAEEVDSVSFDVEHRSFLSFP